MKEVSLRLPMGLPREEKHCFMLSLRKLIKDQNGILTGYDIYKAAYTAISTDLYGEIKLALGVEDFLEPIPYKFKTAYFGMEGMYCCLKFQIYESKSDIYSSENLADAMTKLCEQVYTLKEHYGIKVRVNVEATDYSGTSLAVRAYDGGGSTGYNVTNIDDMLGPDASKWQPKLKDKIGESNEQIGLDDEPDVTNSPIQQCGSIEKTLQEPIKKTYHALCGNCSRFFDYTRDDLSPEIGYTEVIPGANARVKCPHCGIWKTVEFGGH